MVSQRVPERVAASVALIRRGGRYEIGLEIRQEVKAMARSLMAFILN